jgi:chromosome segregation ATPase
MYFNTEVAVNTNEEMIQQMLNAVSEIICQIQKAYEVEHPTLTTVFSSTDEEINELLKKAGESYRSGNHDDELWDICKMLARICRERGEMESTVSYQRAQIKQNFDDHARQAEVLKERDNRISELEAKLSTARNDALEEAAKRFEEMETHTGVVHLSMATFTIRNLKSPNT